jgi:peptidoglycan/LPS O-acetylase OafA/YrhL
MNSQSKHIDLMDYARGVAILAVLMFHTLTHVYGFDELPWEGWVRGFPDDTPSFLLLLPFSFGGTAGVAIFFVVSGFCIHASFRNGQSSWAGFFIRRFFRIYPAYFLAFLFAIIVMFPPWKFPWTSHEMIKESLMHCFLIHNFSPDTLTGINSAFWSLAVEVQLYVIYPLLLYLAGRFGWRPTLAICAIVEILIRGLDGIIQTTGENNSSLGCASWFLSYSPFGFWFSWSIGAYLAEMYSKKASLPRISFAPWAFLALLSYFIKPMFSFEFLWFSLLSATIVSGYLSEGSPKFKSPDWMRKFLRNVGLWSYSIYLLHQPILFRLTPILGGAIPMEYHYGLPMFLLFSVAWAAIIFAGFLSYKIFELPAIAMGKKMLRRQCASSNAPG